jgi:hypothetical protein
MISSTPLLFESRRSAGGLLILLSKPLHIPEGSEPIDIPGISRQHQSLDDSVSDKVPLDGEGDGLHGNIAQIPKMSYHAGPNHSQLGV